MPSRNRQKLTAHRQAQGNPGERRGVEGIVTESLPAANFKIKLASGEEIIGYLAGKMRIYHIKVLSGDRVLVELSPDGKRGRIVRRL